MPTASKKRDSVTFVLGAGASRAVSYARTTDVPSPLDRDFFDLLQRLEAKEKDEAAVSWVLEKMATLPFEYRRSLEKAFYTLHLRSYLRRKLAGADNSEEEAVVSHFARAVVALLRKAHGTHTCENHKYVLQGLGPAEPSSPSIIYTHFSEHRSPLAKRTLVEADLYDPAHRGA